MKRFLVLLALLLPCLVWAQQPNASQTRYQRKDTTKIKWNNSDSSIVRLLQSGQLLEFLLRNNDYGSTDGMKFQTLSPDGDSTLAGLWVMGDGKVYLISGHQSKLIASRLGTNLYGNYILNPATGATYPFFILKSSANDSVYLSMAANGLFQLSRGFNLPNVAPSTPANGDVWRSGNILKFYIGNQTIGFDFTATPSAGMGWRFNSSGVASPGYPDTSGSGGSGGGSSAWDSLTNPGANLSLNMAGYRTTFTYGDVGAQVAFRITDNAGSSSDPLFQVDVGAGSSKNIAKFMNSDGNGVVITNAGGLAPLGAGGYVSANKWNLLDTVGRGSLPVKVAYEDETNSFVVPQIFYANDPTEAVNILNTNTGGSAALNVTTLGNSNSYAIGAATLTGRAIFGAATTGVGGYFQAGVGGTPAQFAYNGSVVADATGTTFAPHTTGGYNLGTFALHFGDVYTDSLFVGTKDSTLVWRGDGKMVKDIHRTTTFTSDTAIINISGIDSTYDATWGFIGKAPMLATPGGKCYNGGNVELTSSTSPMNGSYVWYKVWKRN